MPPQMSVARRELAEHGGAAKQSWIAIDGTVYDVSSFLAEHPGGRKILEAVCGEDATEAFAAVHSSDTLEKVADKLRVVGQMEAEAEADTEAEAEAEAESAAEAESEAEELTEANIGGNFLAAMDSGALKGRTAKNLGAASRTGGSGWQSLDTEDGWNAKTPAAVREDAADRDFTMDLDELFALKNLGEMEAAAYARLPHTSRLFVEVGSEDDETVRNNASAWSKYALVPRVLRSVSDVSTATWVLGHRLSLPVLAGPASFHDRVHPEVRAQNSLLAPFLYKNGRSTQTGSGQT